MKKLLLASAIAALSVSAAQAAPTLYGTAFLTADYVDVEVDGQSINNDGFRGNEDSSTVQINSNTSKIGLKGSEAMTANTDVVYQLEYGINVDDSGSDNIAFKSRDTYLGLANKELGEFRFGRNYSVIDYVNNVTVNKGYWDNIGASSLNDDDSYSDALSLTDGDRVNNSAVWIAPAYNGLPLALALQYGADENDSGDEGFGASLMFDPGAGFTAGFGYESDMSIDGDIIRGTASVDLANYVAYPVTLGALYQQADFDGADEEDALVLTAKMGLTNFARPASVYLQYDTVENLGGVNGNDTDQIVLGGTYSFKDNMLAHAYIGQNSADLDKFAIIDKDSESMVAVRGDADVFAIGGGLQYLF